MKPLISVIIPCCNTAQYIEQCVESVFAQKGCETEIILIDDNSTDNTHKILEGFKSTRNSKVKVFSHSRNMGVSAARNMGIKYSTKKFILFMDSDDNIGYSGRDSVYDDQYLAKLLEKMNSDKSVGMVAGSMVKQKFCLDGKGQIYTPASWNAFMHNYSWYSDATEDNLVWQDQDISACNRLYRTALIQRAHLSFNEKLTYFEDIAFVFNYLISIRQQYPRLCYTPDAIYVYRERPDSAINKMDSAETAIRTLEFVRNRIYYYAYALQNINEVFGHKSKIYNIFAKRFADGSKLVERNRRKNPVLFNTLSEYIPNNCVECQHEYCTGCQNKKWLTQSINKAISLIR